MTLPNDPFILLSYVNTKLRDECESLEAFCEKYETDQAFLTERLGSVNYRYDPALNQFV